MRKFFALTCLTIGIGMAAGQSDPTPAAKSPPAKGTSGEFGLQTLSIGLIPITGLDPNKIYRERWYIDPDLSGDPMYKFFEKQRIAPASGNISLNMVASNLDQEGVIWIPSCAGPPFGGWMVRVLLVEIGEESETTVYDSGEFWVQCNAEE